MSEVEQQLNQDTNIESMSDQDFDNLFESQKNAESQPEIETPPTQESQNPVEEVAQQEEVENNTEAETQEPKKERYVPYDALHEERMRRQELQRDHQEAQKKISQLEQNFQRVLERINKAQEPRQPTFDEDPLEALRQQNQQLQEKTNALEQRAQQSDQQTVEQRQFQEFITKYQSDCQDYATTQAKDFNDAYKFLLESKAQEYKEAGFTAEKIKALAAEDEVAVVAQAYNDGVNPAERLYRLAKIRGYQAKQPQAQQDAPKKENQIDQLQKKIDASKSLNNMSGSTPRHDVNNLEQIANLSDEEIDRFIGNEKDWKSLAALMR